MQGYMVTENNIPSAYGKALNNPQFGAGGLDQRYVPNADELIKQGKLIPTNSINLN